MAAAGVSVAAAAVASQRYRFIDIGANLTDGMFQGVYHGKPAHAADLPAVLQRAYVAGAPWQSLHSVHNGGGWGAPCAQRQFCLRQDCDRGGASFSLGLIQSYLL